MLSNNLMQFVVLFAEIESLRHRVKAKELEIEQIRK